MKRNVHKTCAILLPACLTLLFCLTVCGADDASDLQALDRPILRFLPRPPKDDTNINSLIIRAQTNEAKAECLLGLYYIHGLNVTQDYTNGLKWLSKSADQGFPPAEYALGILFKSGLGVPTNRPTADRWFQKASDQGYVPAEHEAALIADRNGNRDEALKLLRDAAQKGFPSSQYLMGCIASDPVEQCFWYTLSAENVELSGKHLLEVSRTLTKEQFAEVAERVRNFHSAQK